MNENMAFVFLNVTCVFYNLLYLQTVVETVCGASAPE